jgi:hypothetical protein
MDGTSVRGFHRPGGLLCHLFRIECLRFALSQVALQLLASDALAVNV